MMATQNFAEILNRSLEEDRLRLLHIVVNEATQRGLPLYIVGGAVRDLMLGSVINDVDLTVEGDAGVLAESILKKYGGRVIFHSRFGTARWILNEAAFKRMDVPVFQASVLPEFLDLASARSETYAHPGALPTVKKSTIGDDIRRRDFTINAMALRLDGGHFGELLDPLGGESDLGQGSIRALHLRSFVDDPTRMFRAVRYEGRYGFTIEGGTLGLMNDEARQVLSQLSGERVRHELDLILEEHNPSVILHRLAELDLLKSIHPFLSFDQSAKVRLANIHLFRDLQRISPWNINRGNKSVLGWLLWLMQSSHADIAALNLRLQFTADLLGSLFAATSIHADISSFRDMKPSQCVERLAPYPPDAIEAVYFVAQDEKTKAVFFNYLSRWRHVKPHTTGDALKARGLEPGPKYGEIIRRLRAAWLDGEVTSHEEEKKLLGNLLKELT